jgi:hypothetical protein
MMRSLGLNHLTDGRDQCVALVNTTMNLRVKETVGNFFSKYYLLKNFSSCNLFVCALVKSANSTANMTCCRLWSLSKCKTKFVALSQKLLGLGLISCFFKSHFNLHVHKYVKYHDVGAAKKSLLLETEGIGGRGFTYPSSESKDDNVVSALLGYWILGVIIVSLAFPSSVYCLFQTAYTSSQTPRYFPPPDRSFPIHPFSPSPSYSPEKSCKLLGQQFRISVSSRLP